MATKSFSIHRSTDIEGNVYFTARIGDQVWITENLRTTKYNNNTDIPVVTDNATGSHYPLLPAAGIRIMSRTAIRNMEHCITGSCVNTGKLCPAGWHVPNEEEWTTFSNKYRRGILCRRNIKGTGYNSLDKS